MDARWWRIGVGDGVMMLRMLCTLSDGQTEHQLFARFDAALSERGYLAKGGQIVDATIVEARRPRLTQAEKDMVKSGGVPEDL